MAGGVRAFDVRDPSDPEQVDRFDPEGTAVACDTATAARRNTVATRHTQRLAVPDVRPAAVVVTAGGVSAVRLASGAGAALSTCRLPEA